MQQHDEPLAQTMVEPGVFVVSRFVGIDQEDANIEDANIDGPPVLWQTMIFGGPRDLQQVRYTSQAAALKGHEQVVALAKDQGN